MTGRDTVPGKKQIPPLAGFATSPASLPGTGYAQDMSECRWCDIGQHPYPANQQGSTSVIIKEQVANQWNGQQPSNVTQDVCAACAHDLSMSVKSLTREQTEDQRLSEAEKLRDRQGGFIARAISAAPRPKFRTRLTEEPEDDL